MSTAPVKHPVTILGLTTCLLSYTFRADFVPGAYDLIYGGGSALTLVGTALGGYGSRESDGVNGLASAILTASGLALFVGAWLKEIPLGTVPALAIASCGTYEAARSFAHN